MILLALEMHAIYKTGYICYAKVVYILCVLTLALMKHTKAETAFQEKFNFGFNYIRNLVLMQLNYILKTVKFEKKCLKPQMHKKYLH